MIYQPKNARTTTATQANENLLRKRKKNMKLQKLSNWQAVEGLRDIILCSLETSQNDQNRYK